MTRRSSFGGMYDHKLRSRSSRSGGRLLIGLLSLGVLGLIISALPTLLWVIGIAAVIAFLAHAMSRQR